MAQFNEITASSGKPAKLGQTSRITRPIGKTNATGFTLVEVIASLLIVGILGAIAGMGLVTGMKGYMQAKENAHLAQKAQIALTRINRELIELEKVVDFDDEATDQWIRFDSRRFGRQTIAKVGDKLLLSGDVLIDQIESFTIVCCEDQDNYGECNETTERIKPGGSEDLLARVTSVKLNFSLQRKERGFGTPYNPEFSTTVNPRNNGNLVGEEPLSAGDYNRIAAKYQCFITTSGNDSHWLNRVSSRWISAIAAYFCLASIAAGAVVSCRSQRSKHKPDTLTVRNDRGNVLVGLVVIILLFAALGAGLVSLIGTSITSQVTSGNNGVRAYYIAESGFRYAASRYLNTTDNNNRYRSQDEKNQTLEDLHDDLFTLAGGDGQFRLKISPYFLTANGNASVGSNSVPTKFSGGKPEDFTLPSSGANARVKIGDVVYPYTSYSVSTGQLNLSSPLEETIYDNAVIKLVGLPSGPTSLSQGDDLTLADGGFFPKIQGRINIYGVSYGYKVRDGNVLYNLTKAQDPEESFSISVDTATEIVLEPFVKVVSFGMVGQGDLTASREVIYNVPLPDRSTETVEFRDPFNDLSNWSSPTYGSFAIENRGGENVLAVTDVEPGFGVLKAGLIAFNWATNKVVDFAYSHRLAGYYLSYDNQVKIGFDATPFPETGYGPEGAPIPKHYVAGLAFRLDENENFYGLSFMRGCAFCSPADRIPDEIVPENDVNLVVLWQQTGNGTSRKWLAYSELGLLFSDGAELEPPPGKWISENDHTGAPLWTRADNFAHSPSSYSWTTSPSGSGSYNDPAAGEIWNDYLISEPIDLSQATTVQLTFWTRYRLASCEDWGFVEISEDAGSNWDLLNDRLPLECGGIEPNDSSIAGYTGNSYLLPDEEDGWVKKTIDISNYAGDANVRIRFRFERNCCATGEGWWVDDIKVTRDFPIDKSTLLVRIYEAKPTLVGFDSGGRKVGLDTIDIDVGDIVSQSNGAGGTVIVSSLSAGSWASGSAAGKLWINNTSGISFQETLPLSVLKMNGSDIANVTNVNNSLNRTNFIQAYYGAQGGVYPPPTSPSPDDLYPYDQERLRNTFGTANWPPDPMYPDEDPRLTGFNDFYTLVQWNDAFDSSVIRVQDSNGRYSIIISDTLTSPTTYFPFTRPEIGLQVAGHGGANVYFKDYAVNLGYAEQRAMIPIQQ